MKRQLLVQMVHGVDHQFERNIEARVHPAERIQAPNDLSLMSYAGQSADRAEKNYLDIVQVDGGILKNEFPNRAAYQ